ncbi:ribonuclease P protein component [Candidatus Chlorobium masyuteum]|uniref:ribonuclease P protein component n=1 Tax=Candidatus Chlorobium masyuteum TaxID=2716876 RepID=UPI0022A7FBA8|nr:ribonuclease P protein component [Candidatus Chlorobium masyuteum]
MNKPHLHALRKHEILRKKQLISLLFSSGIGVRGDFLKMVYADLRQESRSFPGIPAILFAVSKKTVPSAVRRNRIKRMMREAYRIERSSVIRSSSDEQDGAEAKRLCIVFLFTGRKKTLPELQAFREEIRRLMQGMRLS